MLFPVLKTLRIPGLGQGLPLDRLCLRGDEAQGIRSFAIVGWSAVGEEIGALDLVWTDGLFPLEQAGCHGPGTFRRPVAVGQ